MDHLHQFKATCWLESLIPALEKQLTMRHPVTQHSKMILESSWLEGSRFFGRGWFLSNALMYIRTTRRAILGFETSHNPLVHRLEHGGRVRGKKYELHVG